MNVSQNSPVESNLSGGSNPNFYASHDHWQGVTPDQFSYRNPSQETNALKPQVDSTPRSHSAETFGASPYSQATSEEAPGHTPSLTPTASIASEEKSYEIMSTPTSVKSVGASRNAQPNDDSHASLHSQSPVSQSSNTVCLSTPLFTAVLPSIFNHSN